MSTKRKFEIGDVVRVKKNGKLGRIADYNAPHYVLKTGEQYTASQIEKFESEFKYGDLVEVTCMGEKKIGKVIGLDNDGLYLVQIDSYKHGHSGHTPAVWGHMGERSRCAWYFDSDLKKVENKFKLGDRVVCVKKDVSKSPLLEKGDKGTIIAKKKGQNRYLIRLDAYKKGCGGR